MFLKSNEVKREAKLRMKFERKKKYFKTKNNKFNGEKFRKFLKKYYILKSVI